MRHGEAQAFANSGAERPLTVAGQTHVEHMAQTYNEVFSKVDQVAVSPYLRAQQTCNVVLGQMSPNAQNSLIESDCLTPDVRPDDLLNWLAGTFCAEDGITPAVSSLLLVFHQPIIGAFTERLCGLNRGQIYIPTGTLIHIRCDILAWRLGEFQWLKYQ